MPSPWLSYTSPALVLLFAVAACPACGGRHTSAGDGGLDSGLDADATDGAEADVDAPDEPDADLDADLEPDGDAEGGEPDDTWMLAWGGLDPRAVVHAVDVGETGESIIVGNYGSRAWISRISPTGSVVWSRRCSPIGSDIDAVTVDSEGRVFIAGWVGSPVIAELDPSDGSPLWQQSFSLEPAFMLDSASLATLDDGSVVLLVLGRGWGVEMIRISPETGVLWRRRIVDEHVSAGDVAVTSTGSIAVAVSGGAASEDFRSAAYLVTLDPEGDVEHGVRFSLCVGKLEAVAATEAGGVVLAGWGRGFWVGRLDAEGRPEWDIALGRHDGTMEECSDEGCFEDEAHGVAVSSTGEVLAVGSSTSAGDDYHRNAFAVWLEPDGTVRHSVSLARHDEYDRISQAPAVAVRPDGGWLVGSEHRHYEISLLTSFDTHGSLGGGCHRIRDVLLDRRSDCTLEVLPHTPTVEEGSLELGEADVELEDTTTTVVPNRLCD